MLLTPDHILTDDDGQPMAATIHRIGAHDELPLEAYALTVPLTRARAEMAREGIETGMEVTAALANMFGQADAYVTDEMREKLTEVMESHIGQPVPIDEDDCPIILCLN